MENLINNPIIQQVFFYVLGILSSYLFYLLAIRRKPKPEWDVYSSSPVLKNNGDINNQLKIIYKDSTLNRLTVTTLYLINRGKVALRRNDVPEAIRFVFEEGVEIVDIIDVKKSIESIDLEQDTSGSVPCINLHFNYLNHNDGIMFTILHTGKDSKCISVEGELIDTKIQGKAISKFYGVFLAIMLMGISFGLIVYLVLKSEVSNYVMLLTFLLGLLSFYLAIKTNREMSLPYWITKKKKIKYILEMLGFSK